MEDGSSSAAGACCMCIGGTCMQHVAWSCASTCRTCRGSLAPVLHAAGCIEAVAANLPGESHQRREEQQLAGENGEQQPVAGPRLQPPASRMPLSAYSNRACKGSPWQRLLTHAQNQGCTRHACLTTTLCNAEMLVPRCLPRALGTCAQKR